ncbi:uncharacterized protein METZ01_LOCUS504381, partial [marine metagenome]
MDLAGALKGFESGDDGKNLHAIVGGLCETGTDFATMATKD